MDCSSAVGNSIHMVPSPSSIGFPVPQEEMNSISGYLEDVANLMRTVADRGCNGVGWLAFLNGDLMDQHSGGKVV